MLYDIAVTFTVGPSKEYDLERTVIQWAVIKPKDRRSIDAITEQDYDNLVISWSR